ncbi:MAG: leucine-rich repeat protein [Lachnospiraceae bacterium]|nr:leucine-rich repeat protein [Lachnospiraceae bacterium]
MKKHRWKTLPYLLTISMMFTGMTAVCAGAETFPAAIEAEEADLPGEDMLPAAEEETVQEEEILYQEELPEETDVFAEPSLNPDEEYADDDPAEEEETADAEEVDEENPAEEEAAETEEAEVSDEEAVSSAAELPAPDQAESDEAAALGIIAEGKCGENLQYKLLENGELTISGKGKMYDYNVGYAPWLREKNGVKLQYRINKVIVEDGATFICAAAFKECPFLSSVRLPNTITSMGEAVFQGCSMIESLTFPKDLKILNAEMCSGCTNLKKVTLPEGLTTIGKEVFRQCNYLVEVKIPSTVTTIGDGAFQECIRLAYEEIPSGVTSIGKSIFDNCTNLKSVSLPESLRTIGNRAFNCCSQLAKIDLPSKVTRIQLYTFYGCEKLTEINIPQNVEEIGSNAFESCTSLQTVVLPASLKKINDVAFDKCSKLSAVFYMGKKSRWDTITKLGRNEPLLNAKLYCNPFHDVNQSGAFAKAILWASGEGITSGVTATQFQADALCTRGQIVTFLWRAYGKPEPKNTKNRFKDVNSTSAFYKAILWAVEKGITSGLTETKFGVNETCTRGQAVTFMYRAAGSPRQTKQIFFTDITKNMFCYSAVCWAVDRGITSGVMPTEFRPHDYCTRGQIVTFLFRNPEIRAAG